MTCYAESRDGHEWTQPKLGIVEINGSRENNVILRASPFSTNFSPFLDDRPDVPADQRFKATGRAFRPCGETCPEYETG